MGLAHLCEQMDKSPCIPLKLHKAGLCEIMGVAVFLRLQYGFWDFEPWYFKTLVGYLG
jgi:hypothetical protein